MLSVVRIPLKASTLLLTVTSGVMLVSACTPDTNVIPGQEEKNFSSATITAEVSRLYWLNSHNTIADLLRSVVDLSRDPIIETVATVNSDDVDRILPGGFTDHAALHGEQVVFAVISMNSERLSCHTFLGMERHPMPNERLVVFMGYSEPQILSVEVLDLAIVDTILSSSAGSWSRGSIEKLSDMVMLGSRLSLRRRPSEIETATTDHGTHLGISQVNAEALEEFPLLTGSQWSYAVRGMNQYRQYGGVMTDTVDAVYKIDEDNILAHSIIEYKASIDVSRNSAFSLPAERWTLLRNGEFFRFLGDTSHIAEMMKKIDTEKPDIDSILDQSTALVMHREIRFPLRIGDTWEEFSKDEGPAWSVKSIIDMSVLGNSPKSSCAILEQRGSTGGRYMWYCPGIGLVREESCSLFNPIENTMELIGFHAGNEYSAVSQP